MKNKKSRSKSKNLQLILLIVLLVLYGGIRLTEYLSEENGGNTDVDYTETQLDQYEDNIRITLNDNIPNFEESMLTTDSYEKYGKLDSLGRCTQAVACLSSETMPREWEERGDISDIHPTGWRSGYGWERCHLIAWSLSNENDNERNLITGTHEMNEAMNTYEIMTANYIRENDAHVIYRVTPVFEGDNMIASGIQLEAMSVEDRGEGLSFNVYFYNISPGDEINYETGVVIAGDEDDSKQEYVLNTNSMKFHEPSCSGVEDIYRSNRKTVSTSRSNLIQQGYDPCGLCQP